MKKIFILTVILMASLSSLRAQYKVGSIYNVNGVKGLVVDVDESGNHGLLMSLSESDKDWLNDENLAFETNAFHEDDGMKNMEAIEKYINDNNKSWDDFPIFAWARSLGEGWYIPAREELLIIWKNLNGGNLNFNKKGNKHWKAHNKVVEKNGGDELYCSNYSTMGFKMLCGMISSTEAEGGKVYVINTEKGKNLTNHPMGAPNVKIIEYQIGKKAHRSEGNALGMKRVLHFDTRAVRKF